jgi:pyrroline-5-carboxylate reductase
MLGKQICILGAGNMGRALASGLLRAGTRAERLSVGERSPGARALLARELGLTALEDNAQAASGAGVVVLAVKPQDAAATLAPLAPLLRRERPLLLSVAAGVRIASIEGWCGGGVPVVRAMPNRPALAGAGISGLYAPAAVAATQRGLAESVLRSVGETVWVPEEAALDVVTAVSGSGPAYFFLLAELMAAAGEQLGLERATAQRLAAGALHGAGVLAHADPADLARLRAEVTSPGGTTAAALQVLERAGLSDIVARALAAASQRARELGGT